MKLTIRKTRVSITFDNPFPEIWEAVFGCRLKSKLKVIRVFGLSVVWTKWNPKRPDVVVESGWVRDMERSGE
jgi:hypothetical protein